MSPRSPEQFENMRDASRERIAQSALELFSSKGFFNTSVRQIARHAGISSGLLYNYFSSKEELLDYIVNESFKLIEPSTVEAKESREEEEIKNRIRAFFELLRKRRRLIGMMVQMGIQSHRFEFVNQLLKNKYEKERGKLRELFLSSKRSYSPIEAEILMATMDGVLFQSLVLGNHVPLSEIEFELLKRYSL